jgi:hypothetical protein
MDGEIYEHYFKDQVLQNLPPNSVTVLDNASYHSSKIENIPTPSAGSFVNVFVTGFLNLCESVHGTHYREGWF